MHAWLLFQDAFGCSLQVLFDLCPAFEFWDTLPFVGELFFDATGKQLGNRPTRSSEIEQATCFETPAFARCFVNRASSACEFVVQQLPRMDPDMRIFVSVGEPSGDLHGSNLIRAIEAKRSDVEFVGFAGPKMREAGSESIGDMTQHAIMGFARVVPHLRELWKLLAKADKYFGEVRPDAVVLIDFPGFNWWVARKARKHDIPVFYYGTPQIWAWATHRVKKLRRLVDHSLCKLPFEPAWYRERGCQATYVGHPYFDDFLHRKLDTDFVDQLGDRPMVALLPGSRKSEVTLNLPAFLKTIDFISQTLPETQFAIASYNEEQAAMAREIVAQHDGIAKPVIYVDKTRELIHQATCCLACSGSVSLELLHESTPTVIHYQIDRFQNFLQRCFRKCRFITLVNLLVSERRFETPSSTDDYDPDDVQMMDEAPFPEYLTVTDRSANMAHHVVRWLTQPRLYQEAKDRLESLRESFVKPGASERAADYILQHLPSAMNRPLGMPADQAGKKYLPPDAKVA